MQKNSLPYHGKTAIMLKIRVLLKELILSFIKILPLGGLGEIGLNCMMMESAQEMIVIDCGLHFTQLNAFGVEFAIPDFAPLLAKKDKLKGFFLTHGHEDHIGALVFALKAGLVAPIYCSLFTSLLVQERLKEAGLSSVSLCVVSPQEKIVCGAFTIEFVPVNHSIVDSCALFIDSAVGRIIHTGDFKIDPTPFIGQMMNLSYFQEKPVLLLLSDSTNVERCGLSLSDSFVYDQFEGLFGQSKGLTVVSLFASNVARIAQVFDIAQKQNKKIYIAGRTMEQNVRLAKQVGYFDTGVLLNTEGFQKTPREQIIVLSTGSQGEQRSALSRIAHRHHPLIQLQRNDLVVLSSKFIPGNEKAIAHLINQLFKQGAHVLYEAIHQIHVSGHATKPELQQMIRKVNPRFFIPIHGEYRHLVQHAQLAVQTGVDEKHVFVAVNGDEIELTSEHCRIVSQQGSSSVMVNNDRSDVITKEMLKIRKKMANTGVVFAVMTKDEDTSDLQFCSLEFAGVDNAEIEHKMKAELYKVIHRALSEGQKDPLDEVKSSIKKYLKDRNKLKTVILPVVVNI
jgi:ribonuclease J